MNGRRLVKKSLYGLAFLAILFWMGLSTYNSFFKPAPTCTDGIQNQNETGIDCGGPCADCAIKDLFNIKVDQSQIKYFPADPEKKTTVFYFELKNLNLNYGANFFYYYIDLYGASDIEFDHVTDNSQIYAGGINHIVKLADIPYDKIKKVLVSTTDINWKRKEEFPQPNVSLRAVQTASSADGGVIVSGLIQNNEAFNLSKAIISSVIANPNGIKISASKTELENIPAFSEKAFKINFPKTISLANPNSDLVYYNFQEDMAMGAVNDDVKKIQQFLKDETFYVQEIKGAFDQATKDALIKYQQKAKISPASGMLDSKTRNYINALKKPMPAPLAQLIDLAKADQTKTEIYAQGIR